MRVQFYVPEKDSFVYYVDYVGRVKYRRNTSSFFLPL